MAQPCLTNASFIRTFPICNFIQFNWLFSFSLLCVRRVHPSNSKLKYLYKSIEKIASLNLSFSFACRRFRLKIDMRGREEKNGMWMNVERTEKMSVLLYLFFYSKFFISVTYYWKCWAELTERMQFWNPNSHNCVMWMFRTALYVYIVHWTTMSAFFFQNAKSY